jgi:hypothetical protein
LLATRPVIAKQTSPAQHTAFLTPQIVQYPALHCVFGAMHTLPGQQFASRAPQL